MNTYNKIKWLSTAIVLLQTHTLLHSSRWGQPGDPPASPPAQQEWQLCRLPFFNGTLPLIYWSRGMHHLLWSYWFLSTCHLTPSATVGGGMGLRWRKKGGHRGHHSHSAVVHHRHLHCKKMSLFTSTLIWCCISKCVSFSWKMPNTLLSKIFVRFWVSKSS